MNLKSQLYDWHYTVLVFRKVQLILDLNNLQWEMFHYIESNAKRSYIAGDDDQAIMGFQGANPTHFIRLHKDENTSIDASLVKSRRVPRAVWNLAKQVLGKIPSKERVTKQWKPKNFEGTVNYVSHFEHIECLPAHVLCTHINNAFKSKVCTN